MPEDKAEVADPLQSSDDEGKSDDDDESSASSEIDELRNRLVERALSLPDRHEETAAGGDETVGELRNAVRRRKRRHHVQEGCAVSTIRTEKGYQINPVGRVGRTGRRRGGVEKGESTPASWYCAGAVGVGALLMLGNSPPANVSVAIPRGPEAPPDDPYDPWDQGDTFRDRGPRPAAKGEKGVGRGWPKRSSNGTHGEGYASDSLSRRYKNVFANLSNFAPWEAPFDAVADVPVLWIASGDEAFGASFADAAARCYETLAAAADGDLGKNGTTSRPPLASGGGSTIIIAASLLSAAPKLQSLRRRGRCFVLLGGPIPGADDSPSVPPLPARNASVGFSPNATASGLERSTDENSTAGAGWGQPPSARATEDNALVRSRIGGIADRNPSATTPASCRGRAQSQVHRRVGGPEGRVVPPLREVPLLSEWPGQRMPIGAV